MTDDVSTLSAARVLRPCVIVSQTDAMNLEDQWQQSQRARGLSERTIEERTFTVLRVGRTFKTPPELLTFEQLREWFAVSMHPNTRATYRSHLRARFRWLVDNECRSDDPTMRLGAFRVQRGRPRPVSTQELARVLALPLRQRTRMMVLLAALQGLRVHEVAKIRGSDFDPGAHSLHVVGKGGVERWLPLHPDIEAQLSRWPSKTYWFHSYDRHGRSGQLPVHPSAVSQAIGDAMTRAGVRHSAHALRHWFGTELRRSGADLRTVQELMRHASLATTAIYTAVDDAELATAIVGLPTLLSVA